MNANHLTLTFLTALLLHNFAGSAAGQAPVVDLSGYKPGVNVPLTANIRPVDYGIRFQGSGGDWDSSGAGSVPNVDDAESGYRTSLKGPAAVATSMSTAEDWVATITWTRDDQGAVSHNVWELEDSAGDDIFRWDTLGTNNVRLFHHGVTPDSFSDYPVSAGTHKLTVHYVSAESDFDVWLDDTKIIDGIASELAGGITTGLDLQNMRVRSDANGSSTSRDVFSQARIGPLFVPPEPVESDWLSIVDAPGVAFETDEDAPRYELESSTTFPNPTWTSTGAFVAEGDGSIVQLFDPGRADPSKAYRVVRTMSIVPDADLDEAKNGGNVDFDDGSTLPSQWGRRADTNQGGPRPIGGEAVFTVDKWVRYDPTAFHAQNLTSALSDAEDWVIEFDVTITDDSTNDKILMDASAASGGNIVRVMKNGDPDQWFVFGGNGGGSYVPYGNAFLHPGVTYHMAVHYKHATSLLDFYVDCKRIVSDFPGRHGNYDLTRVQFGDDFPNDGVFAIDNVVIAPSSTGSVQVASTRSILPDPVPQFDPAGNGLQVPFENGLQPEDYGLFFDSNDGGPTVTNGRAIFTGEKAVTYNTSAFTNQGVAAPMNAAEDWVLQFDVEVTTNPSADKNLFDTGAASTGNIVRIIKSSADPDAWNLLGCFGLGQGAGYFTIGSIHLATGLVHEVAVHYKQSNQRMDFYLNGSRRFKDFEGRSGNYDLISIVMGDDFPADGEYAIGNVVIAPGAPGVVVGVSDAIEAGEISVTTETGKVYAAESTLDLELLPFENTTDGSVQGNGGTRFLYEPTDGADNMSFRSTGVP